MVMVEIIRMNKGEQVVVPVVVLHIENLVAAEVILAVAVQVVVPVMVEVLFRHLQLVRVLLLA